jgi:hypothetical protein
MEQNPYAPPVDDMRRGTAPAEEDGFIEGGRAVDAGRGAAWLTEGWDLVKGNVGSWILICILYALFAVVVSIIPIVGQLAFPLIAPMFSAGLYLGCRDVREGREFGVAHLFEGFKHASGLLVIGLVHFAQALVLGGVGLIVGAGGAFNTKMPFAVTPGRAPDLSMLQPLAIFFAAAVLLSIPVSMATYYAPALVAIRRMPPLAALKNSLLAASKNVLPFIVYCLLAGLFSIAAALPCGLGFLVLVPVMIASVYVGYRDVFYGDSPSS